MQVTPHGGLANRCTRPLCDLSVATAAGILSWATPRSGTYTGLAEELQGEGLPLSVSRDDEIRAATIGEPTRVDGPINLADYDPTWPASYEREAARIRAILGGRVRLLEHVGSTSVPGLAAKPIIDIVLGVADSADEVAYVPSMEAGGYVLRIREPGWFEHRLFKGPDASVNLHVFSAGCSEIDRMLAFRDRLRTHDDERRIYEAAKRDLASRDWTYIQHYADAKGEVVEAIIARALADADDPGST
jgi:GrpB-like predicted nucleotidyltransferase (UPF0157 family)